MADTIKDAINAASEEEKLELAMFLMDKFRLRGKRIDEGSWGWDLDYHDFVSALDEFVVALDRDEDNEA